MGKREGWKSGKDEGAYLSLREVEEGDDAGGLVVLGVPRQHQLHLIYCLFRGWGYSLKGSLAKGNYRSFAACTHTQKETPFINK
jgi:hypothetical protein